MDFAIELDYLFIINSNLPKILFGWEITCTTPLRTASYARGVCTITTSLHCSGTPSCRLAMGTGLPSTTGGSSRSMTYIAVRSMLITRPTPCFLMGAHGPHGSSVMTWTMPWRRLLTWHSPPCAHRTCLPMQACLSHCTQFRTAVTQSGRHAWMRRATSFWSTTTVVGHTW
jgi:hypothetical protein